jgi:uncharacterized protein involved in response to NO
MLKIGSFGLLLPIYSTVAHRMFPFFAANVVLGYRAWRPLWLLAVQWPLWLVHLSLELQHAHAWLWLVDLPLCVLNTYMLWRWWPRGNAPALLRVLFLGYAWLPLAMALYATQSLWFAIHDVFLLGRAPVHALSIGFFGSLLVAMVTRVTQGHSGRPLQLGRAAVWAFGLMQVVCLLRLVAEILPDALLWQRLAAWALADGVCTVGDPQCRNLSAPTRGWPERLRSARDDRVLPADQVGPCAADPAQRQPVRATRISIRSRTDSLTRGLPDNPGVAAWRFT